MQLGRRGRWTRCPLCGILALTDRAAADDAAPATPAGSL